MHVNILSTYLLELLLFAAVVVAADFNVVALIVGFQSLLLASVTSRDCYPDQQAPKCIHTIQQNELWVGRPAGKLNSEEKSLISKSPSRL